MTPATGCTAPSDAVPIPGYARSEGDLKMARIRCSGVNDDAFYLAYHDEEWGVPVRDDRRLYEMLVLEGAQAGLSWYTILKKREAYRRAFDGFDPARVARYDDKKVASLLEDPGIVRNRLKVHAAIGNARAWLDLRRVGHPVLGIPVGVQRRRARRQRLAPARRRPRHDAGLRGDEQSAQATRLRKARQDAPCGRLAKWLSCWPRRRPAECRWRGPGRRGCSRSSG